MSEHTGGTWATVPLEDGNLRIVSGETRIATVHLPGGYVPATRKLMPTSAEGRRNADLLVAAPILLRELENFHDFEVEQGHHSCQEGCPIKRAILKAKGLLDE